MGIGLMFMPRQNGDSESDMEMRRRRRSEMNWPLGEYRRSPGDERDMDDLRQRMDDMQRRMEENEMRRRRARSEYDDYEPRRARSEDDPEMRRRRTRFEYDNYEPEMHDMPHMGYVKHAGEAMEKGYASTKELAPNMEGVLEDAAKILKEHPKTWLPYIKSHDLAGIARMEIKELVQALESGKTGKDLRKELVHAIAALFQLETA